jgi:hypothetical protein
MEWTEHQDLLAIEIAALKDIFKEFNIALDLNTIDWTLGRGVIPGNHYDACVWTKAGHRVDIYLSPTYDSVKVVVSDEPDPNRPHHSDHH